jgi:prepilin-type N-terminal cleavage/methylation domain-containing protein
VRRAVAWRDRTTEDGFTLVEMLVSVLLTGILLSIVLAVFSTFSGVEQNNQSNYNELDQLLPVGTSFQHLLRSAVATAPPTTNGIPTPPFGVYATEKLTSMPTTPKVMTISSTDLTFFSNTGRTTPTTAHLLGPTKVTAKLSCPTVTPPTTFTKVKTRACTFTVTTYTAMPKTCPGLTATTTPSTVPCAWRTTTKTAAEAKGRVLFSVHDVNNWTTKTSRTKPVFSYYLAGKTTPVTMTTHGTNPFASCTGSTVTACPAAHIQSIKVDVEVATADALAKGRDVAKVEDQTVTYQLSVISQTYTAAVG